MSCTLNSPTAERRAPTSPGRRRVVLALACSPLAGLAATDPLAGLQRWGSGEFRRFGFLVYEAALWAGDDPQRPPLALRLTYKRDIEGRAIAEASVREIRALGVVDENQLKRWGELMGRLFPDVREGDSILGLYLPEGARFLLNGRLLGGVDDPVFARAFFGIWLDVRTSAPELRAALLRRG